MFVQFKAYNQLIFPTVKIMVASLKRTFICAKSLRAEMERLHSMPQSKPSCSHFGAQRSTFGAFFQSIELASATLGDKNWTRTGCKCRVLTAHFKMFDFVSTSATLSPRLPTIEGLRRRLFRCPAPAGL